MQCFSCHRPCTADALIEDANGNRWHVTCYRDAVMRGGGDDPCPPCDDCNELIWQTEPVFVHEKFESGAWRPARWHPECAPGAPTLGRVENDPPPAAADKAVAEEHVRSTQQHTQTSTLSNAPICPGCDKMVQRYRVETDDGSVWHQRCLDKAYKAAERAERAEKRAARTTATAPRGSRKARQTCAKCGGKIRNTAVEPIECDKEGGGTEFYDKNCYRQLCVDAGQPDPFPPKHPLVAAREAARAQRNSNGKDAEAAVEPGEKKRRTVAEPKAPKEPEMKCSICDNLVPRSQFRDHVSAHEREPGGWSA